MHQEVYFGSNRAWQYQKDVKNIICVCLFELYCFATNICNIMRKCHDKAPSSMGSDFFSRIRSRPAFY